MPKRTRKRTPRPPRPRAQPQVELVKMAVLARRSGVPTPTIKHYIREGLLPGPEVRTSRNMAYYDARMAERIQVIKTLQAEQFLPLRVIAELLEPAPSAALRSDKVTQRQALSALVPAVTPSSGEKRRKRADVLRTESITGAELDKLQRLGILELRGSGETAGYSGRDLELIELIGELRRAGYGDVYPISLVEDYLAAVRQLTAIEIEIFRRHALGRPLPAPLPEVARQAIGYGERMIVTLRAKILPAVLAELARTPASRR